MEDFIKFVGHPIFKQKLYPLGHPFEGENKKLYWTEKHSGRCFYCCQEYKDQIGYSKPLWWNETKDEYIVFGLYCSPNCVKADIIETSSGVSIEQLDHFTHMMIRVYKIFENIVPTPNKYLFTFFPGGTIDYQEWKKTRAIHPMVHLRCAPFIMTQAIVEQSLPLYSDFVPSTPDEKKPELEKKEVPPCLIPPTIKEEKKSKPPVDPQTTKKRGRPRKKQVPEVPKFVTRKALKIENDSSSSSSSQEPIHNHSIESILDMVSQPQKNFVLQ